MADDDPDITEAQATAMKDKIEVLQRQLLLVDEQMQVLSRQYKEFLTAHPTA